MDISNAILAKSDQLNAIDLIGGPRIVRIKEVREGDKERPVLIILEEFGPGRPFKPAKTVLRIFAGLWGKETAVWVGRSLEIYRDESVKWAAKQFGGIRIKAMSNIDAPTTFNLPGAKNEPPIKVTIDRLQATDTGSPDWLLEVRTAPTLAALQTVWIAATSAGATHDPALVTAKDTRKAEIT